MDLRKRGILATDPFGTKPIHYYVGADGFAVASYKSALKRALLERHGDDYASENYEVFKLDPNTIMQVDFTELDFEKGVQPLYPTFFTNFEFDLTQHKKTTEDFIQAFDSALNHNSKTSLKENMSKSI